MSDPLVTIFTAPKAFTNPHIALIQRNAISSWLALGADVQVILIGEEDGMAEFARQVGVLHLPDVERNALGTPLVSSIFALARSHSQSPYLLYVNADILLLPDILDALWTVGGLTETFLLVGQRWDLDITEPIDFSTGWQQRLRGQVKMHGRLHPPAGSDYFGFPRPLFADMPPFAIGRAGWDNWMIYKARMQGWHTIDATASVQIVHQNHDYSHLPGGQTHYRLPETAQNIKLAGGRRTIFTLLDTDTRLVKGKLLPAKLTWRKFWREIETYPLRRLHNYPLAEAFFTVLHPLKAYRQRRRRSSK